MQFTLGTDAGLSPLVGGLVGMLRYARATTLLAVRGLSVAELDHRHDADSNSIGALLLHIAAVEAWYQTQMFDEREWTDDEQARWKVAVDLGPAAAVIGGQPLDFYVDALNEGHERTIRELAQRDDAWLLRVHDMGGRQVNYYWQWFHVCEDEVNHRGQMRWLRKRLPPAGALA